MKKSSKILIAFLAFSVAVLIAVSAFLISKNGIKGSGESKPTLKTITFTVVTDESVNNYTISTYEEMLRGALEKDTLIVGIVDYNGMYVTGVDGINADYENGEKWVFEKNGITIKENVDFVPISDGDMITATLVKPENAE